jgi:2-polyprenyl-6-methoxyphenol hydroxylase-like FAD-dependent oxidoreductase
MAEAGRILITGGGIAGLSLAIALRRRGYTPELAEKCPQWPAAGAGIALHANAVRALRALGLGDAVSRAAAPLPRYGFYDQHGARLCTTDLNDLWGQAGPCLGIARARLQEILATAADGVPHRLGVAVTGLTQQRGGVSVAFADGSVGEYDLAVGADGIYSTVRALAVSQTAPSYGGAVSWRSIIPARPAGVDHLMVFTGERRYFGLVPVGGGHTYGFAGLDGEPFHDPPAGRLDRLRQHFRSFGPPVTGYLAALTCDEQIHFGPIESSTWIAGTPAGSCSSATPPMPARRTWAKAAPWLSKTPSCSPNCCPPRTRSRTRSPASRPGASREPATQRTGKARPGGPRLSPAGVSLAGGTRSVQERMI